MKMKTFVLLLGLVSCNAVAMQRVRALVERVRARPGLAMSAAAGVGVIAVVCESERATAEERRRRESEKMAAGKISAVLPWCRR